MEFSTIMIIVVCLFILFIFIFISYVKAPPSYAFIISGLSKEPRVLIGSGGFRVPFFERLDKVYLGQITVDIKTEESVPTNDFINVDVDAVAKIRVMPNPEGTRLAAKNFLNMTPAEIAEQLQDSLQGNMREIIGTLDLRSLNTDRDGFSDQVMQKAQPDMAKLGIEIIACNIQNVTDKEGLIHDLGADNTAKIKKDAKAKGDEIETDTKAKLKKMIALWDEQTKVNKAIKAAKIKQEADTVHAIQNLTDEEVKHFLHEKWITPVQSGIIATASEVIETLIKQVEALSSKYAVSYNDLNAELVAAQDELSSFISDLTGDEYAIRGLNEFKNSLKG